MQQTTDVLPTILSRKTSECQSKSVYMSRFSNIQFNKSSAITFTMSLSLIYLLDARYFINPQILESQQCIPKTLFDWAACCCLTTRNRVPEFGTELPGFSQHAFKSKCPVHGARA